jgi:hypothetical protein
MMRNGMAELKSRYMREHLAKSRSLQGTIR